MYKVFINESLVFFTKTKVDRVDFNLVLFQELDCEFLFEELCKNPNAKINVICDKLESDWSNFLQNFEVRAAAGGVVKNKKEELLWIYRFAKWDFPKGHIEKGETKEIAALREVEEECGINGLIIDKELDVTYHVFEHKGKKIMKVTYWFLMHTTAENNILVPQTEEGITKVCFKNKQESKKCLLNTYENIKLLMHSIL